MNNRYTNALVLGGGGAKGFAHIGAIVELEKQAFRPDIICGSSSGAIAGAFYAIHKEKISEFQKIDNRREFYILKNLNLRNIDFDEEKHGFFLRTVSTIKAKFSMIKMLKDTAVLKKEEVVSVFKNLFSDATFDKTSIPFLSVAFDLISGKDVYIKSGPLWKAVMASCSIPGIFPPVEYGDMLLVDGGVTNRLPVKSAILSGAKNVMGIDLSGELDFQEEISSVINIHLRIDSLLTHRFDMYNKTMADLIIKPALGDMKWHEFKRYTYAIEKGREAIKEFLPQITTIRSRVYTYKKNIRFLLGHIEQKKLARIDRNEYIFV